MAGRVYCLAGRSVKSLEVRFEWVQKGRFLSEGKGKVVPCEGVKDGKGRAETTESVVESLVRGIWNGADNISSRNQTISPYVHRSEDMLIRDGDRGEGSEGSTADTARKRPERPWTAARTMEVLRRCPLAIAQRLVHCATAVSTTVLGHSHKDDVRRTAVEEQPEAGERSPTFRRSPAPSPCSWSLLGWGSSSTSLLLISPGTRNSRAESNRLYGVGEFTSLTDGFKTNAVKRSTNKHRETKQF